MRAAASEPARGHRNTMVVAFDRGPQTHLLTVADAAGLLASHGRS
jgi:hypothetical protein